MRNLLEWLFSGSDGEDADTGLHVVSLRQEALVKWLDRLLIVVKGVASFTRQSRSSHDYIDLSVINTQISHRHSYVSRRGAM